jgi:hypothetical protein
MIRRILTVVAAAAIPVGFIVATSGMASAGGGPNVMNDTASCTAVTGSLSFNPPLSDTGTATSDTVTIKLAYSGCTDGSSLLTTLTGKVKGTFVTASNSCAGLESPTIVTTGLVSKWKMSPKGTPNTTTLIAGETESGVSSGGDGEFVIGAPGASPGPSSTGAFEGTDGGASSNGTLVTTLTTGELGTACGSPKGLKKVGIGTGSNITFS